MLSASTSMPCSSMARIRSEAFDMSSVSGATLRPIRAIASGTAQCACTSTVFTRRPLTTTSRRRAWSWAEGTPVMAQLTNAMPAAAPAVSSRNSRRVMASHPAAEAAGGANDPSLAHVPRGVEQADAAQDHGSRPAGEGLDHHLGAHAERTLGGGALHGLGGRETLPVLGLEAADHLARAAAHGVAILAQRRDVDLPGQLRHFGARHSGSQIRSVHTEPLPPAVVEDLRPSRQH